TWGRLARDRLRGNRSISAEAGQSFLSSLPDTANGKGSRLLAILLTIESWPAFTKIVEPRVSPITFRRRPGEHMSCQPRILAIFGAAAAEQGIESRAASAQERLVRGFTAVIRILKDSAVALRHLPPFVLRR